MAIILSDNINYKAPKLSDARISYNGERPYVDIQEALDTVDKPNRSPGLSAFITENGQTVEYWYKDGVEDIDLVLKPTGGLIVEKDPDGGYFGGDSHTVYRVGSPSNVFRGVGSLDLSTYMWAWTEPDGFLSYGPKGDLSILLGGYNNLAPGNRSLIVGGDHSEAIGETSAIISGSSCKTLGIGSLILGGYGLTTHSYMEVVLGLNSTGYTPSSTSEWEAKDRLFVIGNGIHYTNPSDALIILKDGTITAPSLTTSLINSGEDKTLVTKEYVDRKLPKTISDATYILLEEDKNKILHFTNATGVTVTVPTSLTLNNRYEGKQMGAGQVTFVSDTGVTINKSATDTNKTADQYSVFGLDCTDTDEYVLFGKLELI